MLISKLIAKLENVVKCVGDIEVVDFEGVAVSMANVRPCYVYNGENYVIASEDDMQEFPNQELHAVCFLE